MANNQKRRRIRSKLRKASQDRKSGNNQKNYRRERARTFSTNNGDDYELEEDIDLHIEKESDATNESESDNNNVERQISEEVQMSVESTRPTRNRQLPIKYR
jgi:hypothetical protein